MTIKAKILDSRCEGKSECFLCRITLQDYVNGLPETYQDYDVQREIVSNVYLDHLVDTVLQKGHIPPIVLVVDENNLKRENGTLLIKTFKILDGLQRTFRLQAIGHTIKYCLENDLDDEYLDWSKFKFSRHFSEDLRKLNSNTDVLRSILLARETFGDKALKETLSDNGQWFEVWTGLTPEQEIRKMLTLNAGHKPVKTRHQLELLFLNLLPILRSATNNRFQLVREKDVSSTQFSKNREIGHFHFAHLITALLSLYEGKAVATSTGLIQSIQSDDNVLEKYNDFLSADFLKSFISCMVKLDTLLANQYGALGTTWLGREVALAGLFGALGAEATDATDRIHRMKALLDILQSNPKILNLSGFEKTRNSLDLSKVNIGNVNRAAIFSAIEQLLQTSSSKPINWHEHFLGNGK